MLQTVRRSLPLFLAVLCLATVIPGLFLSFEDSEIWGITSSRRIVENPWIGSSAHYKPLFSLMFGTIAALAKSDWNALIAARWLSLSFAAGGLFAMYSLGLLFSGPRRHPSVTILFFAIISTMPLMLVHSTKARSDTIATNVILICAFILMQMAQNRRLMMRGLVYVLGGVASLLITPKSIDLVASLGLIFWLSTNANPIESSNEGGKLNSNGLKLRRLLWLVGPAVCILLIGLTISRDFITNSLVYWFDTYTGVDFFSPFPWISVRQAVLTAPFASLMLILGFASGFANFRRLSKNEKSLLFVGLISFAFILIHSQKFYFFLASRIPFLALGALPGLHILFQWVRDRWRFRYTTQLLIVIFLLSFRFTSLRLENYAGFQLTYQKNVYLALENYLDRSRTKRYWDAIGLFPTRNQIFHYPSPGDRTNKEMLEYVENSRPTLIFRTSKMELLEPQFMIWLKPRYLHLTNELYIRYKELAPTEQCIYNSSEIAKIATSEGLQPPLALVTKTETLNAWIRVPFQQVGSTDGAAVEHDSLGATTLEKTQIRLRDCQRKNLVYAVTEAGPWDALPVPVFTPFFGYDGTL